MKTLTNPSSEAIILALMSNSLPQYINPWQLFRHQETVAGLINLASMPNLCRSQNRQSGDVSASFSVVARDDGKIILKGLAVAELEFSCQRCLDSLVKPFEAAFEFVLLHNQEQLKKLDEADDGLVVKEQLLLAPLVEQELILALPMIAKHEDCQPNSNNDEKVEIASRQQPFAHLKDLLE